ncbi:MAG: DUF6491 family protein [Woeseiaceae bacterium]
MKNALVLVFSAMLLLVACETTGQLASQQAVEDYVVVSELEDVADVRYRQQLRQRYINDRYILLENRSGKYLVEFVTRCVELRDNTRITPDVRHETNVIYAKFDTIRGCRIKKIYPVNDGQAQELTTLGDAPGDSFE